MKTKKNVVLLDKLLKISLKDLRDLNLLNSGYRSLKENNAEYEVGINYSFN